MNEKRRKIIMAGFLALVFFSFFSFYTIAHPILPTDMDDWDFLCFHRDPVPQWRGWNPSRVFAEVTMPVVSMISRVLFFQVTGNIFTAVMTGFSISVSLVMTGLVFALCRVLRKKGLSVWQVLFWAAFFLLCHFWIFRTDYQNNDYMLRTSDACTYFFYVIPNLLNAAAVLWLEADPGLKRLNPEGQYRKKSLFLLLAYFCIFSNIWASMIMAVYISASMITGLVLSIREKKPLSVFFREHSMFLLLILLWLVAQFFEMNGLRADVIERSLSTEFNRTVRAAFEVLKKANRRYLLVECVFFFGGVVALLQSRDRKSVQSFSVWLLACCGALLYLVLSCSKTGARYIRRPDVFYGLFFFVSMLCLQTGVMLLKKVPAVKLLLPLLLAFVLVDCNSTGRTFQESTLLQMSPRIINNINNDIVKQLKEAEQSGKDSTTILVPDFENEFNWPYTPAGKDIIGETMWKLGVVEKNILIDYVQPSKEKNELLSAGVIDWTDPSG